MRSSSRSRNHPLPDFDHKWLVQFLMDNNIREMTIHYLQTMEQDDLPSIDRVDPNLPYTKTNIQLVTWKENKKNHSDWIQENRGTPIQQFDLEGNFLKEYPSIKEAARVLNRNPVNIRRAIQTGGKCGKTYWKKKSPANE